MNKSLTRADAHTIFTLAVPGRATEVGWLPPDGEIAFSNYELIVSDVMRLKKGMQFIVGDVLNYGEDSYGEKYAQAVDDWMLAYGSLANYAWVCRRIGISRRRESLSFSHHQEVAPFEPEIQEMLLDDAVKYTWTTKELREVVRRLRDEEDDGKDAVLRPLDPWNRPDHGYANWVKIDLLGYDCVCGGELVVTTETPTECPDCGRRYVIEQETRLFEVLEMQAE